MTADDPAASHRRGRIGEYQIQASVAALHDQAARHADTDWPRILTLYSLLESITGNPMARLNRAVAPPRRTVPTPASR